MRLACLQFAWMLTLLASGCCLPQLSGRYDRCAPAPVSVAGSKQAAGPCDENHDRRLADRHGHHGEHGHGRWHWGDSNDPGTPPGELVPLPKFHPVPVRPAFEPQYDYSQPHYLGPAPHEAPSPPQVSDGVPTPAKPIPDAE